MWLQATSSALLVLPIGHPGFCNYFFFFFGLKGKKEIHKCLHLQQVKKTTEHRIAKHFKDTTNLTER